MKPLLAIGDIHNQIERAEEWIQKFPDYDVIFVGDYFDNYGDTAIEARATALWLKESLHQPNRIHLMGNHDFPYRTNGKIYCPGFSHEKNLVIQEVLTLEDWQKIKYYHQQYNFWFSHAGFTQYWFADPITGQIESKGVDKIIENDLNNVFSGVSHGALWAADRYRGGMHRKGGLLWNDWRNLDFIPGVNQIVGHTMVNQIKCRTNEEETSIHINIDCNLNHCLIIAPNGLTTIVNRH